MHQAGQPALPGVGQVHREKVSLRNRVGCAPPASCSPLGSIAGARRSLRPDVLAIYDCNLKPEILAGLLRAQPLSVISIRRCHSLSGSETLDTLPTGGTVRALMYAGS